MRMIGLFVAIVAICCSVTVNAGRGFITPTVTSYGTNTDYSLVTQAIIVDGVGELTVQNETTSLWMTNNNVLHVSTNTATFYPAYSPYPTVDYLDPNGQIVTAFYNYRKTDAIYLNNGSGNGIAQSTYHLIDAFGNTTTMVMPSQQVSTPNEFPKTTLVGRYDSPPIGYGISTPASSEYHIKTYSIQNDGDACTLTVTGTDSGGVVFTVTMARIYHGSSLLVIGPSIPTIAHKTANNLVFSFAP